MYYDVVCSIYKEVNNFCDTRVESYLLCGGFKTDDEAMEYINNNDCSRYDDCCAKNEYPCIEIEEHDENGNVTGVVTVDQGEKCMKLNYIEEKRDLFTVPEEYHLCHCISADFGMGAGIVVMFNKLFDMKNRMLALHEKEGVEKWDALGTGYVIQEGRVFNLITKRNVWEKPTYKNLATSLRAMRDICRKQDIKKLAMPLIGCGIDGLEWDKVSEMVTDIFKDEDMEILVCIWK